MDNAIRPFQPSVSDSCIDDLRSRLENTRFADEETVDDWSQGIPLSYVQDLVGYWRDDYDMQRMARSLNAWPNFMTDIDGHDIHFIFQRSPHSDAKPLLLTHGWPGSVLEFRYLIDHLTEPTAHGGRPEDAFHVVVPALPGYGFSSKPRRPGTSVQRIGQLWISLMQRLGFERFYAHGGDWGALVTQAIALQSPDACAAIHITLPVVAPDPATLNNPLPEEVHAKAVHDHYLAWETGYSKQQSTRPQTLGYGLADSPVGQLSWIVEKYAFWSDCERNGQRFPEDAIQRDDLLDTVMLYWVTNSAASSARLYWESFNQPDLRPLSVPTGISLFPVEIFRSSRRWAEKRFSQLIYFNDRIPRGGHFAALETPDLLTDELRQWQQVLRAQGITS